MDNVTKTQSGPSGADTAPPAPDLTGRTLGDYQVLRSLGQGGMGQVYLAEQISLKRKVALKILRADLAANPTSLQRFKQEAEAVARATHSNIVQVYAIGDTDGLHYMALEYVEGRNLKEFLAKKGPPDLLLALSVMRQVAAALQRASELGIIHRDIKPENILLTRKGEVKVADFGLSRCLAGDQQPLNLTQSGVTMGTPLYMSPEQVEGRPLDPRTDIYSLGVTCYHMFAGQPPFRGENAFGVALQHVNAQPEPLSTIRPDLPPELCAVVHKMMAKEPENRYQSGRELLLELSRLRESLAGVTGSLPSASMSLGALASPALASADTVTALKFGRRPWLYGAVGLSLVCAILGGAGLGLLMTGGNVFGLFRPRPEPTLPAATPPLGDVATVEALVSLQKREQALVVMVEQHLNPGNDRNRLRTGMGLCLELGLFYLEQWRLDDAGAFFAKLENQQQVKEYRILGQLGQAIVLALRNDAVESNRRFKEFMQYIQTVPVPDKRPVPEKPRFETLLFFQQNAQLKKWIARALEYNFVNATAEQKFPAKEMDELCKRLRVPPVRHGNGA